MRRSVAGSQVVPKRGSESTARVLDDVDAFALNRIEGHHKSQSPEGVADAPGNVEASRVGAIDDVDVVITRHHQHPGSQIRIAAKQIEELYPFGPRAGVGDIASHEHLIDRRRGVDLLED